LRKGKRLCLGSKKTKGFLGEMFSLENGKSENESDDHSKEWGIEEEERIPGEGVLSIKGWPALRRECRVRRKKLGNHKTRSFYPFI